MRPALSRRSLLRGTASMLAGFGGILPLGAARATSGPDAAEVIGGVTRLVGRAEAVGFDRQRSLSEGSPLLRGDRLRTLGAASRLVMLLADGMEIVLGGDADVAVEEFLFEPAVASGGMLLRFGSGAYLISTGAIGKTAGGPEQVRIETPVGSIGIRGTKFWGGPLSRTQHYGVMLLEGAITVGNDAGSIVIDRPLDGTKVDLPADGVLATLRTAPLPAPVRWGQVMIEQATASISLP